MAVNARSLANGCVRLMHVIIFKNDIKNDILLLKRQLRNGLLLNTIKSIVLAMGVVRFFFTILRLILLAVKSRRHSADLCVQTRRRL